MGPKLFLVLAATVSVLLGESLHYGLIPVDYAGVVTAVVTFLAAIKRPPETK